MGTDGQNIIRGLAGGDRIDGRGNVDDINGNTVNDGIAGELGRDRLHGNKGDDVVQDSSVSAECMNLPPYYQLASMTTLVLLHLISWVYLDILDHGIFFTIPV
jgi:Ca2+-binding RTX toxin-like protein